MRISSRFTGLAVSAVVASAAGAAPPPGVDALSELGASQWGAAAQAGTGSASIADDVSRVHDGSASLRFNTNSGFDTWLWTPIARNADWNVAGAGGVSFWVYAENPSPIGFQNGSPWVRLYTTTSTTNNYVQYQATSEVLNTARGQWIQLRIPLAGDASWARTEVGMPDLGSVKALEIHADTWDAGFTLWIDRVAFDVQSPPPSDVRAYAGNARVDLRWNPFDDPAAFVSYAIYRDTAPFTGLDGRVPIATVIGINSTSFADMTAVNGVRYHYAVAANLAGGGVTQPVESVGPRTPRDETDLQVVSIARTPRYPRYAPEYTNLTVTEPGGFGPYNFSVATGLGQGQTGTTQRFPNVGDLVTYTAQIRNRGTNAWTTPVNVTWTVDGVVQQSGMQPVNLSPGASTTFSYARAWEQADRAIACAINAADARASNNTREINSRSVAFLSYVDRTYLEDFREQTPDCPQSSSDDLLDWLNRHMDRFNQMFAAAPAGGTPKRVHFDVLEVLDDAAPDPGIDTIQFAVFPFRYRAGEGTLRLSGYFNAADDIDYGLLHEMGHQLGLIDLYRLDTPASVNQVNGNPYFTGPGLMHGVSPFLSENSSHALTHWYLTAHGYYGQYLYNLPATCRVRVLGYGNQPVAGATVTVYQRCERPGVGDVITDQIKSQGTTDAAGVYTLPNVPIDPGLAPPAFNGDQLRPNPFGYIAVVGSNGLMLLKIEQDGYVDYAWLDITEVSNAYYNGQTTEATFDRHVALGGPVQTTPPRDMAENNAADWYHATEDGVLTLSDDAAIRDVGAASVRADATGGFDNIIRYPGTFRARWDLSGVTNIVLHARAINNNSPQFQNLSPTVRLLSREGYIQLQPHNDLLNSAVTQWVTFTIPIAGDATWSRTEFGTPDIAAVTGLEIHADTWGAGFTLWLDGVGFDPSPCPADFNHSGAVSVQDIFDFLSAYFAISPAADFNHSGAVSVQDIFDFLGAYFEGCA